jgi:hypothetical protein
VIYQFLFLNGDDVQYKRNHKPDKNSFILFNMKVFKLELLKFPDFVRFTFIFYTKQASQDYEKFKFNLIKLQQVKVSEQENPLPYNLLNHQIKDCHLIEI